MIFIWKDTGSFKELPVGAMVKGLMRAGNRPDFLVLTEAELFNIRHWSSGCYSSILKLALDSRCEGNIVVIPSPEEVG